MFDIPILIEEVHKRPALWDQAHPHRHNREVLEVLWEEVAKLFDATPDDTRKKWKGLRDTFRKELRKYPNGFDQDLSQEEFPPWVFFKPLYFLKGQMKARRSEASANGIHYLVDLHKDEDDNSGDMLDSADLEPNVCNTLRDLGARGVKRPLMDDVDDEDYHFFMSLLPHVRGLEPPRKLQLRAKIQDLIYHEVYSAAANTSENIDMGLATGVVVVDGHPNGHHDPNNHHDHNSHQDPNTHHNHNNHHDPNSHLDHKITIATLM